MIEVQHLNVGAGGHTRLVEDDADRAGLVHAVARAFGPALVGYCVMDTHLHVLVEGPEPDCRQRFNAALRAHLRDYAVRHDRRCLLRGAPAAIAVESPAALGRALPYLHRNPVKVVSPFISTEVHFLWSSARAYAGLSLAPFPNVARGLALLGDEATRAVPARLELAGLEPSGTPLAGPLAILLAAAETHAVLPAELVGKGQRDAVVAARRVFAALGRLEGYHDRQLAPLLGRSRSRVTQLFLQAADPTGVRIARTLLRRKLTRAPAPPAAKQASAETAQGRLR